MENDKLDFVANKRGARRSAGRPEMLINLPSHLAPAAREAMREILADREWSWQALSRPVPAGTPWLHAEAQWADRMLRPVVQDAVKCGIRNHVEITRVISGALWDNVRAGRVSRRAYRAAVSRLAGWLRDSARKNRGVITTHAYGKKARKGDGRSRKAIPLSPVNGGAPRPTGKYVPPVKAAPIRPNTDRPRGIIRLNG